MATAITLIGVLLFTIGLIAVIQGIKSRGEIDTAYGKIKGPVWFILVIVGALLLYIDYAHPTIIYKMIIRREVDRTVIRSDYIHVGRLLVEGNDETNNSLLWNPFIW